MNRLGNVGPRIGEKKRSQVSQSRAAPAKNGRSASV
jgi:hypothetical protein